MPRFVLLKHDHPSPHLDLLIEMGSVLWAWRLDAWPGEGETARATRNFDHRPLYLDYEGPIGGGRGSVRRSERGDYEWLVEGPDRLEARIRGERMRGVVELLRAEADDWKCRFRSESDE